MAEAKKTSKKAPVKRTKLKVTKKIKSKKKSTKKTSIKKAPETKKPSLKVVDSTAPPVAEEHKVTVSSTPKKIEAHQPEPRIAEHSQSAKSMDIITPKIVKTKAPKPLSDDIPLREPALKEPLKHKPAPLASGQPVADIKPDQATPRRKLAPLELPIKGSQSIIDDTPIDPEPVIVLNNNPIDIDLDLELDQPIDSSHTYGNKTASSAPILEDLQPAGEDVFEQILEEVEQQESQSSKNIANQSRGPAIGDADELYRDIGTTVTANNEDVELDVEDSNSKQPEAEAAKNEVIEIPRADPSYEVEIKDRRFKSGKVYIFELVIIIFLVAVFLAVLIDAELLDVGITLPFDYI